MSLGRVFARERDLDRLGNLEGGGGDVSGQHVQTLPTLSHSWGRFLPRSGALCSCGLSLCTTPRWHLLITLMPGSKLDLLPHTAQLWRRKVI